MKMMTQPLTALLLVAALLTTLPTAQAAARACNDGLDNDGDGATDYPADPGCESKGDNDEYNARPPAACSDGLDNDSDGQVDYPSDLGCSTREDNDESNPAPPHPDDQEPCLQWEGEDCVRTPGPILLHGQLWWCASTISGPRGSFEAWHDVNGNGLIDRSTDVLLWQQNFGDVCSN